MLKHYDIDAFLDNDISLGVPKKKVNLKGEALNRKNTAFPSR